MEKMEPLISNYIEPTKDKMNAPVPFFELALGAFFLTLIFALPSGITAWFDGLPWAGGMETIVLAVIIPFLLIPGWRFLSLGLPIGFLGVLLFIKIALFLGSPAGGWLVKVHPNMTQAQLSKLGPFPTGDTWVKTYDTVWNKKASGILRKPWTEKLDFPLDWVSFTDLYKCGVSSLSCFDELSPVIEVEGVLLVPQGKKFALVARGVEEGTFSAINENGESFVLSPAKNFKEAAQQQYQLPKDGRWRISGKLLYAGTDWSLIPVWVDPDGEITSELGRGTLWQNEDGLSSSPGPVGFYKTLSLIADGGIIIFLLAWAAWTARSMVVKQILNLPLAVFSLSAVGVPFLLGPVFADILERVGSPDVTTHSYLGISTTAAGIGFLLWTHWKEDFRNFQTDGVVLSVFLLFGPALLFFFTNRWWPSLGQWHIWGMGDDWSLYQLYAREIVVEGEWLIAGEKVFMLQPLYRYFVAIYHWLFGQSAFAQHMADVWCVFGATILLASWALKLRLSVLIPYIVTIVYLMINLIGAFRYHIGRSLAENHAMIFMVLAGWFLYQAREGGTHRIILATLFGILGYWTRQDHLGAIAGLAFLAFEPVEGPTGNWKGYWDRFKLHWERLAWYWGGGILSVLAICFRNWWLGGVFSLTQHGRFTTFAGHLEKGDFYQILTGVHWPAFPPISGFVVAIGTLVGLLALVWRPKPLVNFPLSLGITLVGLLAPFLLLTVTGYPPRFSIHLLPLATLSVMLFLDKLFGGFRSKLVFPPSRAV